MVLTIELSPKQIAEFKDAFSLFDIDGSGTITVEELAAVIKNLGEKVDEKELRDMVSEVDEDGSGEIDFDEFCEMMYKKMNQEEEEGTIMDAFNAWDQTGTGLIKTDDLRGILRKLPDRLGHSEVEKMLLVVDPDKKGEFKFEEIQMTKGIAAMLVYLTKEANEEYIVKEFVKRLEAS